MIGAVRVVMVKSFRSASRPGVGSAYPIHAEGGEKRGL